MGTFNGNLMGWEFNGDILKEKTVQRQKLEEEEGQLRLVTGGWDVQVRLLVAAQMRNSEFVARSLLQVHTEERVYRLHVQDDELHARHQLKTLY